MTSLHLLRIALALLLVGCGGAYDADSGADYAASESTPATLAADAGGETTTDSALPALSVATMASVADAPVKPRIIYEADLTLVVKDFEAFEAELPKLVEQHKGYVADVRVDRFDGQQRTGKWKVRIQTDLFEAFLEDVALLGYAERKQQTAQDVTEEFVDVEARIANKKKLEERLLSLLQNTEAELKDVITVETELARVRGEIEQMEGRLRYLINRTAFTTIDVTAREEQDYVPPRAPTFGDRIAGSWSGSLSNLKWFGMNVVIAVVAVFPWLVILAVVSAPALLYLRRWWKKRSDIFIQS